MNLKFLQFLLVVLFDVRCTSMADLVESDQCRITTIQSIYQTQGRHKRRATTPKLPLQNTTLFAPLTIINWNIEGIKYQLTDPEKLFQNADLVMLTETLNVDRPVSLPGYTCVASPAKQPAKYGRPVGGLTIYAKTHLNIQPLQIYDNRIHLDSVFGQILCYYAHPSKTAGDIIGEICHDIKGRADHIAIIGGDFNCRIENNSTKSDTLLVFMSTIGFQLVNNPSVATFRSKHNNGQSVIDLVFLKADKTNGDSTVDVLRTPSRKHQRVLVRAQMKVASPDLYGLHMKIAEINEKTSERGEVKFGGKSGEKKKSVGVLGKLRQKWKKWFG